jgi:hypothetical protein
VGVLREASMPTSADCGVQAIESFVAADVGMAPGLTKGHGQKFAHVTQNRACLV